MKNRLFKLNLTNNRDLLSAHTYGSSLKLVRVSFELSKLCLMDKKMVPMKYTTLLTIARGVVKHDSDSSNPEKSVANFLTAARSWLEFLNKDEHRHNVGAELNTNFENTLGEFLRELNAAGLSQSTVRDRKSAIRRLHSIYLTQVSIDKDERSSNLGTELRRLLIKSDLSAKELARRANVSFSFIQRVLSGSKPQKKQGLHNFNRIEAVFLKVGSISLKGHFTELLAFDRKCETQFGLVSKLNELSVDEANSSFQNRSNSPLKLWGIDKLKELTPTLYRFLNTYFNYKVEQRSWVLRKPGLKQIKSTVSWFTRVNGNIVYAPTFNILISYVGQFLSFLTDYQGFEVSKLDNPLIFSEQSLYIQFIDFLAERREGKLKSSGNGVLSFASELIREVARQQKLGILADSIDFDEKNVKERVSELRKFLRRFSNSGRVRDPWQRLSPFFELSDPAKPLAELSKVLNQKSRVPQTFLEDAVNLRDAFLISFLLVLPLRERSCTSLTYREDGSGHLRYSKREKVWRVEIPSNQIKNQRKVSRSLPDFLNSMIERYLAEARPRLLETWGGDSTKIDFVFVSSRRDYSTSKAKDELSEEIFELIRGQMPISARLGTITKKQFGIAVRAHAFRHIAATRFLKLNPGQYQACADLLADDVNTVMKHYAFHDVTWNEKILNDSISKAFD